MPAEPDLPVAQVLPDLVASLARAGTVVLEAPPGAGKTSLVPLALGEASWARGGRVVVLEPRRVAARAAAARMADLLGQRVGQRVGYTTGEDRKVGRQTQVEVVTEGVLVARMLRDPLLEGVAAVVLDEFHERSIDADLALAFTLEAAATVRTDLRLAVMSATLEGDRVADLVRTSDAGPVHRHRSDGRVHPVTTEHRPPPRGRDDIAAHLADVVTEVVAEPGGDVLAFLPGAWEIRRAVGLLRERVAPEVDVCPLYGALPVQEQRIALSPSRDGRRRIVVATDIAESSLTVPGVRIVVDAGLARRPRFDPVTGMSRLETLRVARSSADQRRGRAARQGPGRCLRLWPQQEPLEAQARPAIAEEDSAPTALAVAAWGTPVTRLALLDQPPAGSWAAAMDLLRELGAVDDDDRLTDHGEALVRLPLHPRLAHMVHRAPAPARGLAADVAALLGERDVLPGAGADLADRVAAMHGWRHRGSARRGGIARVRRVATRVRRRLRIPDTAPAPAEVERHLGPLVALAYPDRVAQRRDARPGRFVLAGGRGATVTATDPLATQDLLAVAHLDRGTVDARIHLAAALDEASVAPMTTRVDVVEWGGGHDGAADVVCQRQVRLGALVLTRGPLPDPPREAVLAALTTGVRDEGLRLLEWSREVHRLRDRLAFLHRVRGQDGWPAVDDETLLATLEEWLVPFLTTARRRADLAGVPSAAALMSRVPFALHPRLDELAPPALTVPSGSAVRLDYAGDQPVLAVKLQEMFGVAQTPRVAGEPVLLHLLSPARRPVQVTSDLAGFWQRGYADVRAELRGRYPKHPWPEDPLSATPTARTKRRGPRS